MLAKKLLLNMMGRIMVGSEAVRSGHQEKPSVMRVGSNQMDLSCSAAAVDASWVASLAAVAALVDASCAKLFAAFCADSAAAPCAVPVDDQKSLVFVGN